MLTINVTILIAQFPAGWLVDKIGAKPLLFVGEILGISWAVLSIIYAFFPQFWLLIISRVVLGVHIALWHPAAVALFTNVNPERKSRVYNSIAIFRNIGWVPGGFIAGFIYEGLSQPFGFVTPLFILIGGLLILMPLFYFLPNKPTNQNSIIEGKEG